jgi:SNF2 family DNA or RNA helicase
MIILHGTWIPHAENDFVQEGAFYLWAETLQGKKHRGKTTVAIHPKQLFKKDLADFLAQKLGIKPSPYPRDKGFETAISPQYFLLPTAHGQPLPSLELARYLEEDLPDDFELQYWQIDCYITTLRRTDITNPGVVNNVVHLLNDLHFIALNNLADVQLGADLLFWYTYTQFFKQIISKDQYIPALKYRALDSAKSSKAKGRQKKTVPAIKPTQFEIYPGWEIVSEIYESALKQYIESMPLVCVSGFADPIDKPVFYDPERLLRHFSECLLTDLVIHTASPKVFEKKIENTLLHSCLNPNNRDITWTAAAGWELYQQWRVWRDRISRAQSDAPFYLGFKLTEPFKADDAWQLEFQVASRKDPSLQIALQDYWRLKPKQQKELNKQLGEGFEQHLLMNLGYAARIYPKLWAGLESDQPLGISLPLAEAFEFLKEDAWILEDAGYKVMIPAWWTPQGRKRAKVRLKAKGKSVGANSKSKSYFSVETLVSYQYELAIGEEPVSEQEWQQLVNAKSPLVQFRGQWIELDQAKMQEMLAFWQKQQKENPEMSLLDFMRLTAEGGEDLELDVARDQLLSEMVVRLSDKSKFAAIADPKQFQGSLREYQKRGVAWIHYLETLGLNGCLADDMGLGKSAQVIARLVQEREEKSKKGAPKLNPTLLIAPTSVVGNWQKEIEKFAPHLRSIIHHGSQRIQEKGEFKKAIANCDVLITSFTLARKDVQQLESVEWHRLVVDEAQNIKNPKTAQTKAILKLKAKSRFALTGTPIENRLLDLWSIFNFLNPGYLGKEAQFRQSFETPIQKNNDGMRSATLKKLVEPFILRRVKTDQSIIKDLPDKVEQKQFCNLTKEQASLYEAVVKDITKQLEEAGGIQRKGMILGTLVKLKQICNHPMQFLQDNSEFTPERSHKLSRLVEMIAEAIEEGESMLVFSQFTEIGDALQKYLRQTHHINTYYLHGGTARAKREKMIAEFQDPETEPSVFILSLKAGGVGITLTKANHVFHFDRWWNPAVEDQATDRAFRIGQKKNVFVHKFVAIGTLEERIDQMIEDKKKLAGSIVGSDESWLTELDNEAFKKLISLNKNAVME